MTCHSGQSEHDGHLIDEVARQMTDTRSAPDLRAGVLSRLEDRPSSGGRRWLPLVALAATVIVAAVAVTVVRRGTDRRDVPLVATAPPAELDVPGSPASVTRDQAAPESVPRTGGATRKPVPQMSEAEQAWHARAIPALRVPDALVIGDIGPAAIEIAALTIEPISLEALTVPPIGGSIR